MTKQNLWECLDGIYLDHHRELLEFVDGPLTDILPDTCAEVERIDFSQVLVDDDPEPRATLWVTLSDETHVPIGTWPMSELIKSVRWSIEHYRQQHVYEVELPEPWSESVHFAQYGLWMRIKQVVGPASGNPLIEILGRPQDFERWKRTVQ